MPTQEELNQAYAQQQAAQNTEYSRQEGVRAGADQAWAESSPYEQAAIGFAKPFVQAYEGVKGLVGGEQNADDLLRLEQAKGGYGTAGEIAGDIAMLAVPAGRIAKVASGLPRARAAWLAGAGGEAALSGLTEGVKAPETGETRMGNAGPAALVGGLGASLGPASRQFIKSRQTPEAAQLLAEGVPLTPAMTTKGTALPYVERKMSDMPILGKPIKQMQDKALERWNANLLNKVTPDNVNVTEPGFRGFQQAQRGFTRNYSDAWSKVNPDTVDFMRAEHLLSKRLTGDVLPEGDMQAVNALRAQAQESMRGFDLVGDYTIIERLDDLLRNSVPADNPLAANYVKELRKEVLSTLPKEATDALKALDNKWSLYKTTENAANRVKALEREGTFTTRDLQTAVKNRSTPGQAVSGQGRLQAEATAADRTLGKIAPERSQINVGGGIAPYAMAAGAFAEPTVVLPALGAARMAVSESMRKGLTGTPLSPEQLMAYILRAGRGGAATHQND